MFSLLLSTWFFLGAEHVKGVIQSHFYSLIFLFEASFMLKCCGWWEAHKILETAQSPNSPFTFLFDLDFGLFFFSLSTLNDLGLFPDTQGYSGPLSEPGLPLRSSKSYGFGGRVVGGGGGPQRFRDRTEANSPFPFGFDFLGIRGLNFGLGLGLFKK